ncbi:MAG: GxxExxY protein [bacterium]
MTRPELMEEALTKSAIGAFFEVYNALGYGFLERIYVAALEEELRMRGHDVEREVRVRVTYKTKDVGRQRLDMVVDGRLVIEVKSTFNLHSSASRQLYNYLHATRLQVGLLLHFGPEARFTPMVCTGR